MTIEDESGTDSARDCARHIAQAFARYNAEFRSITRRAPLHFDRRDWKTSQRDAVERIELYDRFVNRSVAELRDKLGDRALDRDLWTRIRLDFAVHIAGLPDGEFTKTFFS
jgi:isocitrate dehydrogenase kinase/phosphatase